MSPEQTGKTHLRKQFFRELAAIKIKSSVNEDTIDQYSETVLQNLILFIEQVVTAYTNDLPSDISLVGKEQEQKAFKYFGLTSIHTILDEIIQAIEHLHAVQQKLIETIETDVVILPPASAPLPEGKGAGIIERILVPRLQMLLFLLLNQCSLTSEQFQEVTIFKGAVQEGMYRQEPYTCVQIPSLNRLVFVCDEKYNATYIFDTEIMTSLHISADVLSGMTKDELNAVLKESPFIGKRIISTSRWMAAVHRTLSAPIPARLIDRVEQQDEERVATADEGVWKKFWTDEKGCHWASKVQLSDHLGKSRHVIHLLVEELGLPSIKAISGVKKNRNDLYCLESIISSAQWLDLLTIPSVIKSGDDEGWYIDSEGRKWGSINKIMNTTGSYFSSIQYLARVKNLPSIRLFDGEIVTGYCLEHISQTLKESEDSSVNQHFTETPAKGLFHDENGEVWGSPNAIASFIGVSGNFVRNLYKVKTLEGKQAVIGNLKKVAMFSLSEVLRHEQVRSLLEARQSNILEGEFIGFYQNNEGLHFGLQSDLAKKLKVSIQGINRYLQIHGSDIRQISMKNRATQPKPGYCWEDIQNMIRFYPIRSRRNN